MDKELADFNNEWKTGNRAVAKQMAIDYVKANPNLFAAYDGSSLEELVSLVSLHRSAGREAIRTKIDMYLLAKFEPQQIGGNLNKRI